MDFQARSDLGPLLSSQVGQRIFVDLAQQPLKIFVEPGEVANRPRLVRILKNGGGLLCEDVTEADIVVVEPETVSATQLIESWVEEKVLLNTNWVYRSIERGGAYLEDENWGGFAVAKGNAVTLRNHLPTPRETPSEQQVPQEESVMQNQPHSSPNASQLVQAGSPVPLVSQFQIQQMSQQLPNGQSFNAISGMMHPNANVVVPAQLLAQLMGAAQQHGMSTAAMSMPQVAQIPNQMPLNAVPGQPFVAGLPQQAVAPFMSPPGIFVQGSFPLQQQSSTFPQQVVSMPFSQQPMDVGSPVHSGHYHGSVSPEGHSQMHRHSNMSESCCSSPMDLDEPPALKRKARSADPMTGSSRKMQAKARDNGAYHSKRHRRNDSYDGSLPPSADASPVSSSQREDEKLFEKSPKVPFRFFVQLGMRNRSDVAQAIKKHGGKMESNIADADFVILGSPTTKNFEEWLRQSGYFGKIPVKPQWVLKCVDMNYIVELDEYVYEGCKVKKRGSQSSTGCSLAPVQSGSEAEEAGDRDEETDTPAQDKEHKQTAVKKIKEKNVNAEKKLRNGLERQSEKKANNKAISIEEGGRSRVPNGKTNGKIKAKTTKECSPPQTAHWAPSPPPPTRVVEHVPGKNRYTEDDMNYCDKYIPILLERDPTTTVSSIADKLHTKMPHHPKGSWMSHLTHPSRREKLEAMRRRAEISHRKARPSISMVNKGPPSNVSEPSDPPVAAIDPFQVLTTFFAEGRADNLADSAVWHVMAGEYPQMSAVAWEAFWVEHHETIAVEVSRLTGLDTQQGAGALARSTDGQIAKTEPD